MVKNQTGSLDWFRFVAAFMVVAIHIYPLSFLSADLDFVFTRILFRVAVPFFFMVSGYFVLSKLQSDRHDAPALLKHFLKKALLMYALCILIYLPIALLTEPSMGVKTLIVEVLLDGPFYHLWYFPALILGTIITGFLLQHLTLKRTLLIVGGLYILGCSGDSYYGLSTQIPGLKQALEGWYSISPYTRNGLFMAPLFLTLGVMLRQFQLRFKHQQLLGITILTCGLMVLEGWFTYKLGWQKHNAMYLMLPVVMVALFSWLLQRPAPPQPILRNLSATIYIIHPLVLLVLVFILSRIPVLSILVNNSLLEFILVAIFSTLFAFALYYTQRYIQQRRLAHA